MSTFLQIIAAATVTLVNANSFHLGITKQSSSDSVFSRTTGRSSSFSGKRTRSQSLSLALPLGTQASIERIFAGTPPDPMGKEGFLKVTLPTMDELKSFPGYEQLPEALQERLQEFNSWGRLKSLRDIAEKINEKCPESHHDEHIVALVTAAPWARMMIAGYLYQMRSKKNKP